MIRTFLALVLIACVPLAVAQKKNKGDDQGNTRGVQGMVTSPEDTPVDGAVVQLKNTKTLSSFDSRKEAVMNLKLNKK